LSYERSVFINCPFDPEFKPLFDALVFTVLDCGFMPRCALEAIDSSVVRIEKIAEILSGCRLGIHDISRTDPSGDLRLPRFNMPLELGLFLGAKRFGDARQRRKKCLILDKEPYRYQVFCSDIAGQDIAFHRDHMGRAIIAVRDWLQSDLAGIRSRRSRAAAPRKLTIVPGGPRIVQRYERFRTLLPEACGLLGLDSEAISFADYLCMAEAWLTFHQWRLID
jgi:hypothetical protein